MSASAPRFDTIAVHGGAAPDPTTGSRAVPIYQTVTYNFKDTEHAANLFGLREFGNIYSRIMNPTNDVLEQRIAALHGGTAALAVSSGHAAENLALLNLAGSGDSIVSSTSLYGGTWNIFLHTFKRLGITVRFVEPTDIQGFVDATDETTKAWFVETIGNPCLDVPNIRGLADAGRERGVLSFPNFGHWRVRGYLGLRGRMPVSRTIPYSWYDTPNIHHTTIKNFREFVTTNGGVVLQELPLASNRSAEGVHAVRFASNLRAELAVAVVTAAGDGNGSAQ